MAERELSAFMLAVTELFGPEQARLSAEDWLDESETNGQPAESHQSRLASGHGSSLGPIGNWGDSSARSSNACRIDRYERVADTIVQLFRIRVSGVCVRRLTLTHHTHPGYAHPTTQKIVTLSYEH